MGAEGCPGACPILRAPGWLESCPPPGTWCSRVSRCSCFILQHPAPGWAQGCLSQAATLLGLRASYDSLGGVVGAGSQQREGGTGAAPQAPPAPCAPALRLQASQTSDCLPGSPLPATPPRALTSAAGCPGLLALAGKVDCLGRLLLHLGWVSRAGRKQACVEFLFDPHGGINRKRRAPSRRALHLPFVVGSAIYRLKELSRDPCPVCRLGTAGGAPCEYTTGRQQGSLCVN